MTLVGFVEQVDRLLDSTSGPGETLLVHRQLTATGVDRLAESHDRQIGEFLGDLFQSLSDLLELTGHTGDRIASPQRYRRVMDGDELHEWITFADDDGNTWQFDVTFLTSNYGCIYGRGCPGVFTELAPEYEHGCCTYGAHFVDKADRTGTAARAASLGPDEWEFHDRAEEMGGPIFKNDDGEWVTRSIDDACIFLNRPGFAAGAGCAFHQAALARGERPLDWKPQVCWQVPLRFDEWTDDNQHTTYLLREWKRRDWGEGGAEFAWWCTDDPLAFTEDRPVWRTLRDEIVELVGQSPYERLVDYLVDREARHPIDSPEPVFLPHPQVRRRNTPA